MLLTVVSYKGGVGKTMTAIHLAAFLARQDPRTVLIDGDPNRSAARWQERGRLPFPVVDEHQTASVAREYNHIVVDLQSRPSEEDLASLAHACDLLILPLTPDRMALDAMLETRETLDRLGATNHRVLLTIVPPAPSRDGNVFRSLLEEAAITPFTAQITRAACFNKAADLGLLVDEIDHPLAARGWAEYEALGQEMLQ
jgi:chromosome partitioning protein